MKKLISLCWFVIGMGGAVFAQSGSSDGKMKDGKMKDGKMQDLLTKQN